MPNIESHTDKIVAARALFGAILADIIPPPLVDEQTTQQVQLMGSSESFF